MVTPTFGQQNLPPPQTPFVDIPPAPNGGTGRIWGSLSKFGLDYLNSLFLQATTPTAGVSTGLTATGATQGTALALQSDWNDFSTVAANTGGKMQARIAGQVQEVFNGGANALKVYPPVGGQIDALGANNPYSLPVGKRQRFNFSTSTVIRSTQLG